MVEYLLHSLQVPCLGSTQPFCLPPIGITLPSLKVGLANLQHVPKVARAASVWAHGRSGRGQEAE